MRLAEVPIMRWTWNRKFRREMFSTRRLTGAVGCRPIIKDHGRDGPMPAEIGLRDPMRAVENVAGPRHDDRVAQVCVEDIARAFGDPSDRRSHVVRSAKPDDFVEDVQAFDRNGYDGLSFGC